MSALLTIAETAKQLGVSRSTVERLIRDGQLAPVRFRGLTRISTEALGSFIACNTVSNSQGSTDSEYLVSWNRKKVLSVKTAFGNAVERAGIDPVTIHDLRRTCATWMRLAGVPLAEVAAMLGDEVRTIERHYARYGPDYLRDATGSIG